MLRFLVWMAFNSPELEMVDAVLRDAGFDSFSLFFGVRLSRVATERSRIGMNPEGLRT